MRRPLMPKHGQPFEDDALGQIEVDACRTGMPSSAAVPPLRTSCKPRSIAAPLPDISSSTSTPSPFVRALDLVDETGLRRDERRIARRAAGQLELRRIDVDREDERRAGGPRNRDRHEPDRADAGDRDALHAHARRHDGVHRVAERIEDRGEFVGDRRIEPPHVVFGHRNVFAKAPSRSTPMIFTRSQICA